MSKHKLRSLIKIYLKSYVREIRENSIEIMEFQVSNKLTRVKQRITYSYKEIRMGIRAVSKLIQLDNGAHQGSHSYQFRLGILKEYIYQNISVNRIDLVYGLDFLTWFVVFSRP